MNLDAERKLWLVSLGMALALHAAVFCLLVGWPRHPSPPPPIPMQAVMVEMAPTPAAPPAPPTAVAPGTRQQERPRQQPVPRPHPPTLPPIPITKSTHDALLSPPSRPRPAQPTARASQEVDQTTAPPSVQAPASASAAAPRTSDATGQSTLVTWQSMLLGHLARYRRYPTQAERARQQGIAYVRFTVNRKGEVLHARLERSSGHILLDQEALATMHRASPVPPPPTAIPGNPVEVVLPVVFSLRKE